MTDQDPTQRYEVPPPAPPTTSPEPFAPEAPPAAEPVAAAPTAPVTVTPAARPGRSRIRWLVAGVVTLLVVGTAAGATLLLTRDAGTPDVLAWTPADSVIYSELRLDLPGGQQAELAKVMSAFPGFDDQAAFQTKLNEALDQLVKRASDDKMSYQGDIAPWFGGQLSASVGPLPAPSDAKSARALVLASVTDAAKAEAWAAALLAESGATSSTDTYNGVKITIVTPPAGSMAGDSGTAGAYALVGPVLAVGDPASVKAAIDTKGASGLAGNDQFRTAAASLSGDRLGFAYVDTAALAKGVTALQGDGSALPQMPAIFDKLATPWTAAAVRASDGAIVVETRMPHVKDLGPATSAESKLPALVPASTVALIEGHDVGATLEQLKALAADEPLLADGVKQLDDSLKLVGGFGSIVDWIGEAGVAITRDGDTIGGGLVVTPTDKAAADRLLTQLRGFIELGGASAGIKVSDETYGDATITTVDLGDAGSLMGLATGGSGTPTGIEIKIAYSVTDQVVVLGYGADFVMAVLDARTGDSLATTERFGRALARIDKAHGSLVWLDIAGIRDLIETQVPDGERGDYDANVKPYLAAFDSLIGGMAPGDALDRGTLVLTVRNP